MERKITEKLLTWKNSRKRNPLLVCGARQVGKTYSVLQFGREHYNNVVYFNFESSIELSEMFERDIDPKRIIANLEARSGQTISEGSTLIVFDEIQSCNRALTSLKYFCEDAPGYHIIATGSLMGIALDRRDFSFPVGKADILRMFPLDIEEFMWAVGKKDLADLIRSSFRSFEKFSLHDTALDVYRQYISVGGMPAAVSDYAENKDMIYVSSIHGSIDSAYTADMSKYATPTETRNIRALWSSIPRQLINENRRFVYNDVKEGARHRDMVSSLDWIRASGMVYRCVRVDSGAIPLSAHTEDAYFKLFIADTGILCSKMGVPLPMVMLSSGPDSYKGAIAENYVMQSLTSNGIKPYYWASTGRAELDFLYQDSDGNIIPVEVKSSEKVRSKSLALFSSTYDVPYSVRISEKNFGYENGIKSIPLYAAFCIGPDR